MSWRETVCRTEVTLFNSPFKWKECSLSGIQYFVLTPFFSSSSRPGGGALWYGEKLVVSRCLKTKLIARIQKTKARIRGEARRSDQVLFRLFLWYSGGGKDLRELRNTWYHQRWLIYRLFPIETFPGKPDFTLPVNFTLPDFTRPDNFIGPVNCSWPVNFTLPVPCVFKPWFRIIPLT